MHPVKKKKLHRDDDLAVVDQDDLAADEDESFDILDVLKATRSKEEVLATKLREEEEVHRAAGLVGHADSDDSDLGFDVALGGGYGSDRDEDVVTFGGQATFSVHSRKAAKRARRPNFERSDDAVVQTGALTRAGVADDADVDADVDEEADAGAGAGANGNRSSSSGFAALGVSALLCGHLEKQGFKHPTPVQARSIPPLLQGKDVLVESATGSGKTLSYLVPVFDALAKKSPKVSRADGTLALILCQTRELCLQVLDTATIISRRFTWIVPGSIHGGENRAKEKARLRKGVNVLICTPGRLYDHLTKTAAFDVRQVEWIVLDEADRLLDLGFKKQIRSILEVVRARDATGRVRQTALLSATLSGVKDLLDVVAMRSPVRFVCWFRARSYWFDRIGSLRRHSPPCPFCVRSLSTAAMSATVKMAVRTAQPATRRTGQSHPPTSLKTSRSGSSRSTSWSRASSA